MPRQPDLSPPPRIAKLASLPVFFKLGGRKVLLVGASEGAGWKAELLAAAGAHVEMVIGAQIAAHLEALAHTVASRRDEGFGSLTLHHRDWQGHDLDDAVLALADLPEDEAKRFQQAARRRGIPVNVIDNPPLCDFQFGSIVNRSPMVVGISTDGVAPVLGQAIRARIESVLPRGLATWLQAARRWRADLQAQKPDYAQRRRFWERFTAMAFSRSEEQPQQADRDALMQTLADDAAQAKAGHVALVGAGPGDPELLTLKAMRFLQAADVILYDDLVSAQILELGRREAQRIMVGKTGRGPSCKQSDINDLVVKLGLEGKRVVRLKGGDPLIFGRATEELEACQKAGIATALVPGISAAQGAAAALGLSLTERKQARRLQFLTGHGEDGQLPADICWPAIADPLATTVLYMARGTLKAFTERAMAAGLDPQTPAAAIIYATRANQNEVFGTIETLPGKLAANEAEGPTLVMIGAVLRERSQAVQVGTPSFSDVLPHSRLSNVSAIRLDRPRGLKRALSASGS